jgi:hypothetical protein
MVLSRCQMETLNDLSNTTGGLESFAKFKYKSELDKVKNRFFPGIVEGHSTENRSSCSQNPTPPTTVKASSQMEMIIKRTIIGSRLINERLKRVCSSQLSCHRNLCTRRALLRHFSHVYGTGHHHSSFLLHNLSPRRTKKTFFGN